jgi:selenocysteine-specific elongation factor
VAGGVVLDTDPPARPGSDPAERLTAREGAGRGELAWRVVADRGARPRGDIIALAGVDAAQAEARGAVRIGSWLATPELLAAAQEALAGRLAAYHDEHPLREGLEVGEARAFLLSAGSSLGVTGSVLAGPGLVEEILNHLVAAGDIARTGTAVRLAGHAPRTQGREDADQLVSAVRSGEPSPPTVRDLTVLGFGPDLIKAVCAEGRLVRVSPEIVVTPGFLSEAERLVRDLGKPPGLTVSGFREALGTSRKYALPILEHFDSRGVTRRDGDHRVAR